MALLTITQQQALKPISPNWASYVKLVGGLPNYEQLEKEVEEKELKILLGISFLQDLQYNPTTTDNVILLDGGSYLDSRNETIYFKGLRYILSFLVYSKYIGESFVADTFTGMVKKNREETENLSEGNIKRLQGEAREIALQEFEVLKDFLCRNTTKYPYWHACKTKSPYRPKIYGVKRTIL